MTQSLWHFWIDRGGTFTDCIGRSPQGELHVTKVLSSDQAPLEGIRQILGLTSQDPIPECAIHLGTTIATNALLERKGTPFALAVTTGFHDLLDIGTQQRPHLFELAIQKPSPLYKSVIEIHERLSATGHIIKPLDTQQVEKDLTHLLSQGIQHLAIVLLHGYAYPTHEQQVASIAAKLGFTHITCSSVICPEIGFSARGDTTAADCYLTPHLSRHLQCLHNDLGKSRLSVMKSSGGVTSSHLINGHEAILSGPAGGVSALSAIATDLQIPQLIGFDMGGTSTDVSRYNHGFEHVYETTIGGIRLKTPMLAIHTIAAGGGSICRWQSSRLTVGPDSAGSDPGPLCYHLTDAKGQPKAQDLTLTDCHVFLGRIQPDQFPLTIHKAPIGNALKAIQTHCDDDGQSLSLTQIAEGFLSIANTKMADAIKTMSVSKGDDVRQYHLCCFGGAGALHACAIARLLAIKTIVVHPLSGVLSAYGIGLAHHTWEGSHPIQNRPLSPESLVTIKKESDRLIQVGTAHLRDQHSRLSSLTHVVSLDLRFVGTEVSLTIPRPNNGDYNTAFHHAYHKAYGHTFTNRPIEITQCRVQLSAQPAHCPDTHAYYHAIDSEKASSPLRHVPVTFSGNRLSTPIYSRKTVTQHDRIQGPAILLDDTSTIVVEPGFVVTVHATGCLLLSQETLASPQPLSLTQKDPISLEVFNHAFMSIADHMGAQLQRTATSTNVKDRLDFSCALFDSKGHLVANAPHIPVHLGAMGHAVQGIIHQHPILKEGDVYLTNNPYSGGSHLPDLTTITPMFSDDSKSPSFFVASRAHHADIGGKTPGSMPAFSTHLSEEGLLLDGLKIVSEGLFNETLFKTTFLDTNTPSRNPTDNYHDLLAQIAANNTGVTLLTQLIQSYGLHTVQTYMTYIRENAADQVQSLLNQFPPGCYSYEDTLDDNTPIKVAITLSHNRCHMDFTGTGPESEGNFNAPQSIVKSAILYVLRCLVSKDIPLNEGCFDPVTITIPTPCLLNPSPGRAVAAGNVETSQRIVDVLLGAFGIAAASQGTMNNLTFGNHTFSYYETICGGSGATAQHNGAHAVHTHMTNTRITDPELLETRYPVRLWSFSIRPQSGGRGLYSGGNGCIRDIEFLSPVEVSLLSQRRANAPFGLKNGTHGCPGKNIRIHPDGHHDDLGPLATYHAKAHERLQIHTPGGGGFGTPLR